MLWSYGRSNKYILSHQVMCKDHRQPKTHTLECILIQVGFGAHMLSFNLHSIQMYESNHSIGINIKYTTLYSNNTSDKYSEILNALVVISKHTHAINIQPLLNPHQQLWPLNYLKLFLIALSQYQLHIWLAHAHFFTPRPRSFYHTSNLLFSTPTSTINDSHHVLCNSHLPWFGQSPLHSEEASFWPSQTIVMAIHLHRNNNADASYFPCTHLSACRKEFPRNPTLIVRSLQPSLQSNLVTSRSTVTPQLTEFTLPQTIQKHTFFAGWARPLCWVAHWSSLFVEPPSTEMWHQSTIQLNRVQLGCSSQIAEAHQFGVPLPPPTIP